MTISEMYQEMIEQQGMDNLDDIIIDDYILDTMIMEIEYDV